MSFQIKDRDTILIDIIANYVSDAPDVNDFSPGSTLRSMFEAFSTALEDVYSSMYLGSRRALEEVPSEVFGLIPKEGVQASVNVTFTKETGVTTAVTVEAGTRISNSSDIVFVTAVSLVIAAGVATGTVRAVSENVGRRYNIASGVIDVIEGSVVGIESVTNGVPATGGEDSETELDFRYRFNLYVEGLGLCNRAGLEAGALSVVGVTDARAVDLSPPLANVNCNLYIDNSSTAGISDSKIAEVRDVIDGDGTSESPGYRSVGVNVAVLKPTIVPQDVEITMLVGREYTAASMENVVENRVAQFMNKLRIGIGLRVAELVAIVILIPGVLNASVVSPSSDVLTTSSQVVRSGTFTFTTSVQV